MKNFEAELPQNYKLVKTIDAKNVKIGIILNLIAVAVVVVCMVVAYFIIGVRLNAVYNIFKRKNIY